MPSFLMHRRGTIDIADVRATLALYPANYFDAVLTDPPYGLSDEPDMVEVLAAWLDGRPYVHAKAGFMGNEWDSFIPGPDVWREAFRVLKPGGHLMAFAGARTHDLMTLAIRLSGFEIRDCLMWIYATGFPKSMNIGKAIDKRRDDDVRPVCRFLREHVERAGVTAKHVAEHFAVSPSMLTHWAARDSYSQPSVPTWEQWQGLKTLVGFGDDMDAEVRRLNQRKGELGDAWHERPVIGEGRSGIGSAFGDETWASGPTETFALTAPASEAAADFEGHETVIKPAHEPITVAMKPMPGTYAANALAFGVAGLNVAAARIGKDRGDCDASGRWPSNVLFDEGAAPLLDAQSPRASRFFYVAKPTRKEKDAGLEALASVLMSRVNPGGLEQDPRWAPVEVKNDHPTVKPIALSKQLATLLLPPRRRDGAPRRLLVPFSGSGSEIIGVGLAGWEDVTGIDLNPHYAAVAAARIAHHLA